MAPMQVLSKEPHVLFAEPHLLLLESFTLSPDVKLGVSLNSLSPHVKLLYSWGQKMVEIKIATQVYVF